MSGRNNQDSAQNNRHLGTESGNRGLVEALLAFGFGGAIGVLIDFDHLITGRSLHPFLALVACVVIFGASAYFAGLRQVK